MLRNYKQIRKRKIRKFCVLDYLFERCRAPQQIPNLLVSKEKEESVFVTSSTEEAPMGEGGLQPSGLNYRLKVDLLRCIWVGGGVRIKCSRAGTSVHRKLSAALCGASTHQSPGGKNRPEILKFQDGEDERLKKSFKLGR